MDQPKQVVAAQRLYEFEPDEVVITVRMPGTYHRILKAAAHRAELSLNRHCLVRLLDGHDEEIARQLRVYAGDEPPESGFRDEAAWPGVPRLAPDHVPPEPNLLRT